MQSNVKMKSAMRRVVSLYLRDKRSASMLIINLLTSTVFLAIAPMRIKNLIDYLQNAVKTGAEIDMSVVISMLWVLLLCYTAGYAATYLLARFSVSAGQKIVLFMRESIQKKLHRLSINYIDTHPIGEVLSKCTEDMVTLSDMLENSLMSMVSKGFIIVGVLFMMFVLNPALAIIFLVSTSLSLFAINKIKSATNKMIAVQRQASSELNSYAEDTFSGFEVIKAFNRETACGQRFMQLIEDYRKSYVKSRYYSGYVTPITKFIYSASYVILCVFSGLSLLNGSLTLGAFQAFLVYAVMISDPISAFSLSLNNIQAGTIAARRVFSLIDEPEISTEQNEATTLNGNGNVKFENVSFGYAPDKLLFNDVSFSAESGQKFAVVGPSGAGKTTLVNLLLRFYEINGGHISVNDTDVNNVTRQDLREQFGIVLQDSWIFEGTIAENIGYGKENATLEEIIAISKAVRCHDFIMEQPQGYDTILNENAGISAGQKQLLCIARTALSNPKILILDEATSQVDTRTELLISRAMEELTRGRTSFVIAHRLLTIMNADKIIYMQQGDIKEVGAHSELISKKGLYYEMFNSMS